MIKTIGTLVQTLGPGPEMIMELTPGGQLVMDGQLFFYFLHQFPPVSQQYRRAFLHRGVDLTDVN